MSVLWSYINKSKLTAKKKNSCFIILCCLLTGLIGFILWFGIHFFALNTVPWAIIFTCYPAVAAWFVGIIYLYNHSFDN